MGIINPGAGLALRGIKTPLVPHVAASSRIVAHYEYSPFGRTIIATGPLADSNSFRFSTKYYDSETSLYYYGYRYYSPGLGRWMSRDPLGDIGCNEWLLRQKSIILARNPWQAFGIDNLFNAIFYKVPAHCDVPTTRSHTVSRLRSTIVAGNSIVAAGRARLERLMLVCPGASIRIVPPCGAWTFIRAVAPFLRAALIVNGPGSRMFLNETLRHSAGTPGKTRVMPECV